MTIENNADEFVFPDETEDKKTTSAAKNAAKDELEIDVVDDTPAEDRNRTPSKTAPEEPSDDELQQYSEKVQKRFKSISKGYHDERRAKEQASRERDEAVRVAQIAAEEVKRLRGNVNLGQTALLAEAKKTAAAEASEAKRALKEAQESFDSDAIVEAQDKLLSAKIKQDRLENFRVPPLQEEKKEVQTNQSAQTAPPVDPKAIAWKDKNSWFGANRMMTAAALGLHEKLVVEDRINPQSDEYYQRLDGELRKRFPEEFDDAPKQQPSQHSTVAPATRTTAPKKVTLTQRQVDVAKKMKIPLEEYARHYVLFQKENQ